MSAELHDILTRAKVNRITIVEFFNEETARTRAQQLRDLVSGIQPWARSIDIQSVGRKVILSRQ